MFSLLKKIGFLFHEDSQYTGVLKYCAVYLKIDYTLRCLEYICSVSSVRKSAIDKLLVRVQFILRIDHGTFKRYEYFQEDVFDVLHITFNVLPAKPS